MTGVAVHGLTPFDVPYISQVTDNLWQGGCAEGLVLPGHIDHVVSLYPWEKYTITHPATYREAAMYDDLTGPNVGQVAGVADYVNECRKTGVTLVHCQAGLNRSSLVVALAMMLEEGLTARIALDLLREKRSPAVLCNPVFEQWLLDL